MGINERICPFVESLTLDYMAFSFGGVVQKKGPAALKLPHLTMGNKAQGAAIKQAFESKPEFKDEFLRESKGELHHNLTLNRLNLKALMAKQGWVVVTARENKFFQDQTNLVTEYHRCLGHIGGM